VFARILAISRRRLLRGGGSEDSKKKNGLIPTAKHKPAGVTSCWGGGRGDTKNEPVETKRVGKEKKRVRDGCGDETKRTGAVCCRGWDKGSNKRHGIVVKKMAYRSRADCRKREACLFRGRAKTAAERRRKKGEKERGPISTG